MALRIHSDNTPSHFKSSKTMHFLTTLVEHLKPWRGQHQHSFRVIWEFGAPGHGKGVWDGIGAWMKRTVRQDIVDHKPNLQQFSLVMGTFYLQNKSTNTSRCVTSEYICCNPSMFLIYLYTYTLYGRHVSRQKNMWHLICRRPSTKLLLNSHQQLRLCSP